MSAPTPERLAGLKRSLDEMTFHNRPTYHYAVTDLLAHIAAQEAKIETLELAGDVIANLAKLVTRDDGIDPEAHHIELTQEEAHLIRSVAEQALAALAPSEQTKEKA